jgi:hypothetical protein
MSIRNYSHIFCLYLVCLLSHGSFLHATIQSYLSQKYTSAPTLKGTPQGNHQPSHCHCGCYRAEQSRELKELQPVHPLLYGHRHHALLQGSGSQLDQRKTVETGRSSKDHGSLQHSLLCRLDGILPSQWGLPQPSIHRGSHSGWTYQQLYHKFRISLWIVFPLYGLLFQFRSILD